MRCFVFIRKGLKQVYDRLSCRRRRDQQHIRIVTYNILCVHSLPYLDIQVATSVRQPLRPLISPQYITHGTWSGVYLPLETEAEAMATEPQSEGSRQPKEQVVDPWNVSAAEGEDKIDYDKLIGECG